MNLKVCPFDVLGLDGVNCVLLYVINFLCNTVNYNN
jgi:hypothetical protein